MASDTTTVKSPAVTPELTREVEEFLFAEADLLDDRSFPDWLSLFTPDCTYWIPAGSQEQDPMRKVSIVYDRHNSLAERVWRFEGGLAYAQQPESVTSHLIGNIVVEGVEEGGHESGDVITVRSRFVVTEFRAHQLHTHAGRYLHRLVRTPEGLRILEKRVDLVNRNGRLGNLGLPL